MAGFGEPQDWTAARKQRMESAYPELAANTPDEVLGIDSFAHASGDAPTAFTSTIVSMLSQALDGNGVNATPPPRIPMFGEGTDEDEKEKSWWERLFEPVPALKPDYVKTTPRPRQEPETSILQGIGSWYRGEGFSTPFVVADALTKRDLQGVPYINPITGYITPATWKTGEVSQAEIDAVDDNGAVAASKRFAEENGAWGRAAVTAANILGDPTTYVGGAASALLSPAIKSMSLLPRIVLGLLDVGVSGGATSRAVQSAAMSVGAEALGTKGAEYAEANPDSYLAANLPLFDIPVAQVGAGLAGGILGVGLTGAAKASVGKIPGVSISWKEAVEDATVQANAVKQAAQDAEQAATTRSVDRLLAERDAAVAARAETAAAAAVEVGGRATARVGAGVGSGATGVRGLTVEAGGVPPVRPPANVSPSGVVPPSGVNVPRSGPAPSLNWADTFGVQIPSIPKNFTLSQMFQKLVRDAGVAVSGRTKMGTNFAVDKVATYVTEQYHGWIRKSDGVAANTSQKIRGVLSEQESGLTFDANQRMTNIVGVKPITLADLAADYRKYRQRLTLQQRDAIDEVRDILAPFEKVAKEVQPNLKARKDIRPGGFYIPRNYVQSGNDFLTDMTSTQRGIKGRWTQDATIASDYEAIQAGRVPEPTWNTIETYIRGVGATGADNYYSKYMTAVGNAKKSTGQNTVGRISIIAGQEFPAEFAAAAERVAKRMYKKPNEIVDPIKNVSKGWNALQGTMDAAWILNQGLTVLNDSIWRIGKPAARKTASDMLTIGLQVVKDADGATLGRAINAFDDAAAARTVNGVSRPAAPSSAWAKSGLPFSTVDDEFVFDSAGKFTSIKSKINPIAYAQWAMAKSQQVFGAQGTITRMNTSNDELIGIMETTGKTWQQLQADGTMDSIARVNTYATGMSEKRFGGDLGQVLLYASRFFQSRLEMYALAAQGSIPARGALSKVAPFIAPESSLEQRIARRMLARWAANTVALTVLYNSSWAIAKGEDPLTATDFNPTVDGVVNPEFMVIHGLGYKFSLGGPQLAIAMNILKAGTGDIEGAARGQAGVIGKGYDVISGFDAIGQPTTIGGLLPLPFSLGTLAQSVSKDYLNREAGKTNILGGIAATGAGFIGARTSPDSIKYQVRQGTFNSTDAQSIITAYRHEAFNATKMQYPHITEDSFYAWYTNAIEELRKTYTSTGASDSYAQASAERDVKATAIAKLYAYNIQKADANFTMRYPDKAREILEYYQKNPDARDPYTPTQKERAYLERSR